MGRKDVPAANLSEFNASAFSQGKGVGTVRRASLCRGVGWKSASKYTTENVTPRVWLCRFRVLIKYR